MRHYQQNPWFSPPALQYVARFTGNPPAPLESIWCPGCGLRICEPGEEGSCGHSTCPHGGTESSGWQRGCGEHLPRGRSNPPGYGSSMLEYDNYESPPGYGVMHNPGFRAGESVTWSEEALEMGIGRPGQIMRVRYPGIHPGDAGRSSIEFESGRSRMVNNWEIERAPKTNPWFSPPALQYVARFTGNPPGYGSSMLEYDNYESPPGYGVMHNPQSQVLCGCGWGSLGMEESQIPARCPNCGSGLRQGGHSDEYWEGVDAEQADYDDPSFGAAYGDEGAFSNPPIRSNACYGVHFHQDKPFDAQSVFGAARQFGATQRPHDRGHIVANPGDSITIRGRAVPVDHSAKGGYHHVRVADPSEFKAVRTKTLSAKKGIKARVGIFKGKGPRGGNTEIQSYLFDAKVYTPQDVVRWIEGHRTPAPLRMEISSASPSKRRMKVYGEEAEAPRKKHKQVKAKAKRKPRKIPAAAKRCTAKTKSGRCKGYKQAGKAQCALHAAGVAGKRQPKKRRRKVG